MLLFRKGVFSVPADRQSADYFSLTGAKQDLRVEEVYERECYEQKKFNFIA